VLESFIVSLDCTELTILVDVNQWKNYCSLQHWDSRQLPLRRSWQKYDDFDAFGRDYKLQVSCIWGQKM